MFTVVPGSIKSATGQTIHYSRVNCVYRLSKFICYGGVRCSRVYFHMICCNSPGLSNIVCENRVFVIAGFVITGCHHSFFHIGIHLSTLCPELFCHMDQGHGLLDRFMYLFQMCLCPTTTETEEARTWFQN